MNTLAIDKDGRGLFNLQLFFKLELIMKNNHLGFASSQARIDLEPQKRGRFFDLSKASLV